MRCLSKWFSGSEYSSTVPKKIQKLVEIRKTIVRHKIPESTINNIHTYLHIYTFHPVYRTNTCFCFFWPFFWTQMKPQLPGFCRTIPISGFFKKAGTLDVMLVTCCFNRLLPSLSFCSSSKSSFTSSITFSMNCCDVSKFKMWYSRKTVLQKISSYENEDIDKEFWRHSQDNWNKNNLKLNSVAA